MITRANVAWEMMTLHVLRGACIRGARLIGTFMKLAFYILQVIYFEKTCFFHRHAHKVFREILPDSNMPGRISLQIVLA